jgi:hypothetical protein
MELSAWSKARQLRAPVVERLSQLIVGTVGHGEPGPVGETELVEVCAVPAGEGVVDGGREGVEGMAPGCGEGPSRA